jgi:hypothetical protein
MAFDEDVSFDSQDIADDTLDSVAAAIDLRRNVFDYDAEWVFW